MTCPECGTIGSAAVFAADTEARECMRLIAELPIARGVPILPYLALFRPTHRALSWHRAHKLLDELADLMTSPAMRRGGRDIPVTPELWCRAISQMMVQQEKITRPLTSHSYLLTILVSLAEHRAGDAEAQHDAALRAGLHAGHGSAQRAYEGRLIASENNARKQFGQPPMTPGEVQAYLRREARK